MSMVGSSPTCSGNCSTASSQGQRRPEPPSPTPPQPSTVALTVLPAPCRDAGRPKRWKPLNPPVFACTQES